MLRVETPRHDRTTKMQIPKKSIRIKVSMQDIQKRKQKRNEDRRTLWNINILRGQGRASINDRTERI